MQQAKQGSLRRTRSWLSPNVLSKKIKVAVEGITYALQRNIRLSNGSSRPQKLHHPCDFGQQVCQSGEPLTQRTKTYSKNGTCQESCHCDGGVYAKSEDDA